jgi:hypothetical protein
MVNKVKQSMLKYEFAGGYPREEAAGLQPTPHPHKLKSKEHKNTDVVDTTISNILCDLPFSQSQPLKSADD